MHPFLTGSPRSLLTLLSATLLLWGCAQLPANGPSTRVIEQAGATTNTAPAVQVVDIDAAVVKQLATTRQQLAFSEAFGPDLVATPTVGAGDSVEVTIWEAPPATLFGASSVDAHVSNTAGAVVLPPQMVDREGFILIPFVGRVRAAGLATSAVGADIAQRLQGKAHQPQVLVRITQNASSTVTVVGEVNNNLRMPLTASGERLLDALAAAGGVRQAVSKVTVQMTRGAQHQSMPLDQVIRDPGQNVRLRSGDVVTALVQPLNYIALGATGRQNEVPFESQGISLAQAIARSGGLLDSRSDAQGVFLFRLESRNALAWPREPVLTTPDGQVPVIYRLNLRDPASFFVMQSFAVRDRDILYVSNAPVAELQKFMNLVFSINRVYTLDNAN